MIQITPLCIWFAEWHPLAEMQPKGVGERFSHISPLWEMGKGAIAFSSEKAMGVTEWYTHYLPDIDCIIIPVLLNRFGMDYHLFAIHTLLD